jgi:tripartite-type tricarboxylate transporter receptor subunit TctC
MNVIRRRLLEFSGAALAAVAVDRVASAQSYPARPVRLIVPFAPGGPTDLAARLLAEKLSGAFGVPFHVENMPGAGGNVGTGQAAKSVPDGSTILVAAPSFVTNPSLFDSVPYDAQKDFTPVTIAVTAPTILTVHPSVPANTVKDLVDLIRSNPGKFSYASPGSGTPPHLVGELFRISLDLDLVHVPFKSGGLSAASAMAGHTPISFGALPPAVPLVKDGRLRALAMTSTMRSSALPDCPNIAESGYPDIAADIWTALLVPARTSRDIVSRLHEEVARIVSLPEVRGRLAALGYAPLASSPEDSATQMLAESQKWAKVIKTAGIKPE